MLADDVYDAFLLVPLYIAMYYKQDLHIHGPVSKKLYKNTMHYLQRILCDFSDDLSPVNVTVDGFKVADGNPDIVGAGLSCGVDSLSTVYDWYVKETDPDYRISALFFMDTGWNGDFINDVSKDLCMERYDMSKKAANELGIPLHLLATNLHALTYKIYPGLSGVGHIGYLTNYSCVLGLQRAMKRYYTSNCFSYSQILNFSVKFKDRDFAEFSESYSVPLIQTEKLELVIDGCQYERNQKIEKIVDWDIAQKYLSPCVQIADTSQIRHADNCSSCRKCMSVMMTLDALGKLDKFSEIFDLSEYKKHLRYYKFKAVYNHFKGIPQGSEPDIYVFLKKHGMKLPSFIGACMYFSYRFIRDKVIYRIKRAVRKVVGDKVYDAVKRTLKRPTSEQSN